MVSLLCCSGLSLFKGPKEGKVSALELLSVLQRSSEGRVSWSGFILGNEESLLEESFPDFVVEGEGD